MCINIEISTDNVYPDETVSVVEMVQVEAPAGPAYIHDWADDNLFPYTGTGGHREHDRAAYFTTVTRAPKEYEWLIGSTFEWGD